MKPEQSTVGESALLPLQQAYPRPAIIFLSRLSNLLIVAMVVLAVFQFTPVGFNEPGVARLNVCIWTVLAATLFLEYRLFALDIDRVKAQIRSLKYLQLERLENTENSPGDDQHRAVTELIHVVKELDALENAVNALYAMTFIVRLSKVSQVQKSVRAIVDRFGATAVLPVRPTT